MTQETKVFQLAPRLAAELKARLAAAGFEFRPAPYAFFNAKGEGVVATFYESGKLVVQGAGASMFAARFVDSDELPSPAPKAKAVDSAAPMVGSDECGKGDYFGPLVVCAVRLTPEERKALAGGSIRDSKTLSDEACVRLGAALRGKVQHSIARLDPPDYNATWGRLRNVNEVLADLHARAIRELAQTKDHVLIDKFADESLLRRRLAALDIQLEQRVRAESETAVAAASIIAREEFLTALRELSDEAAIDLHKGAGDPVDVSARKYVALHGRDALGKVAKLHFKNTQKLGLGPT